MANIICPNCRTVVPVMGTCSQCGAALAPASAAIVGGAHVAVLERPLESPSISIESLAATEPHILSEMDPRLQRLVLRSRQGIRKARTASTAVNAGGWCGAENSSKVYLSKVSDGGRKSL